MPTYGTILCYAHYEFIYNIWNHVAQYKCAWSICINKNVYVHYETRYRHIETYCALSSHLSTYEKILWYVDMYNYIVHYKSCANIDAVVKTLRMLAEKLFKWFKDIQMKDHTDQWNLILSTGDSNKIQIGNSKIRRSFCEKLYCFKFVHKLPTDEHVKSSCKNAHVKLKRWQGCSINGDSEKEIINKLIFLLHNSVIAS